MSAHAQSAELVRSMRPQRFAAETFEAFRIIGNGRSVNQFTKQPRFLDASPIALTEACTLDEAAQLAATHCDHKDHFVIRRKTAAGNTTLHFYAVKRQSRPTRVYRDYAYHNVHRLYAEHLFDVASVL